MLPKHLLAGLVFVASAGASWAKDDCTKGSEFEPPLCPLRLPRIVGLTIVENAAKSPAETDPSVSCADFSLKPWQVRRYLARAKVADPHAAHYTLDWSPCYASGTVAFGDGSTGQWRVDQFRGGSLLLGDGKRLTLYCPRCEFSPFVW